MREPVKVYVIRDNREEVSKYFGTFEEAHGELNKMFRSNAWYYCVVSKMI